MQGLTCRCRRMPLAVLCGLPCSGKSTAAAELAALLRQHADGHSEKRVRGAVKAETERRLSKRSIVILDSLNSIKGFRYELWCLARATSTRYCIVHCNAPASQAQAWNAARPADQSYSQAVFQDLAARFEAPDPRNRWDSPLFAVGPGQAGNLATQLQPVLAALADVAPAAARGAAAEAPAAAANRELQPTCATTNPALLGTNLLHQLDAAAQGVIAAITDGQAAAVDGCAGMVDPGGGCAPLELHRPAGLPELRRHKRAFLKLATQISGSRMQDAQTARAMFVDYLRDNLERPVQ